MLMKKLVYAALSVFVSLALASAACSMGSQPPPPDTTWDNYEVGDEMTPAQEEAFFKTYVSIGDSLTHGCQGLNVEEGRQQFSYPNLLANAMGTEFNQPLVFYPGVGIPNPEDWVKDQHFSPLTTMVGHMRTDYYLNQGVMNNFAITGATLPQILDYDLFNVFNSDTSILADLIGAGSPFAFSVLRGNTVFTKSAVTQALEREPTFLTVWIGNNDVMFSTIMGDTGFSTATPYWEEKWNELVQRIKDTPSIRGVLVINLPDNTKTPFLQDPGNPFHTVAHGLAFPEGSKVPFFSTYTGPGDPVLTPDEIAVIQSQTRAINSIIQATCEAENWPMIDAWSKIREGMETGWELRKADGSSSGVVLTGEFATGGMFSLDGIHPTSAAYAYMADIGVDVINAHYGTHLPYVDAYSVWQQDTLCQAPVDPRYEEEMCTLINDMFRLLAPIF